MGAHLKHCVHCGGHTGMDLLVVSVQSSKRKGVQTASLPSRDAPGEVRGWDLLASWKMCTAR